VPKPECFPSPLMSPSAGCGHAGAQGSPTSQDFFVQSAARILHGHAPALRARGSLQCLVGYFVGEDIFVSLISLAFNGGIIHGIDPLSLALRRQR
jgi:hypothetical protein